MIDEKKLIRVMWDRYNEHYNNANRFSEEETEMAYRVLSDLQLTIENMPRVGEWIPCSERLPKCNGCCLVWRPHFFGGEVSMPAICYFDGQDTWHDSYGVDFTRILNKKDVIAWMPLPEPYKEGE